MTPRIDVHHHVLPPDWIAAARNHKPGGWAPHVLEWTPQGSIDAMDRHGISLAIVSLGLPGVWWAGAEARRLARACNEYAAGMQRDYPGRFGFFATIPLPDVEGSLEEIAYALDVLHADGIGFITSYGDRWPGDPAFDPVFAELDRRGAVAYFHPTVPNCCNGIMADVPVSTVEYVFDTTRAITNLLFTGTLAKYRRMHFIFSHAGGTIPMLANRIAYIGGRTASVAGRVSGDLEAELRRLNYEIATSVSAPTLGALRAFVPVGRILLGTDYPYVGMDETIPHLDETGLSAAERRAIEAENPLALFPRLRTVFA